MSDPDFYPVVVIGGGPTGLTLASLLGRYGTRALLVERNATTVMEPRAVSIDDESLRTMQAAGVIGPVIANVVQGYGSEYYSPGGRLFLKVEPNAQPYGYARRNAFRQPVFEATLRAHLEDVRSVELLFGWALDSFRQEGSSVELILAGPDGGRRTVRCDYLVGADGARSTVRAHLGLSLAGESFSEQWLIVDLENSPAPSRETIVFCDVRRPCIALPGLDDTRRFEFKLLPGETPAAMEDQRVVDRLIRAHGADPGSRVCRKVVYTFHARLAPRWSSGRAYLAGDACHLTPPFAGQGMNSGIRDAHNLAWKLAWVAAGRLPARLLDSYETERRAHVGNMIGLALRMGRIMAPRSRLAGAVTQGAFRLLGLWPRMRDYFAQMKYKPQPRFTDGFILPDGSSARATQVGRLLPQPVVKTLAQPAVLLDELLGDGFALIGLTDDVERLRQVAPSLLGPLSGGAVLAVRSPGGALRHWSDVTELADPANVLRPAAGPADRLLIVRPDRYVMAACRMDEADACAEALRALLERRTPRAD